MSKQFNIRCPLGVHNQEIYYDDEKDDRVKLLEKLILDYWADYCNSHWIWHHKFIPNKLNYEDKVKAFLSRCGDFLLYNRYGNTGAITPYMDKKIKTNEYSLEGDWQNEGVEIELEETVDYLNKFIKEKYLLLGKLNESKYDNVIKKKKLKFKNQKINMIYSHEGKEIKEYRKIKISKNFCIWDKTIKNITKRKGLIDKSKPYTSKWCIVNTENEFEFQDKKYKISEEISQYNIRKKKPNYDDYKNDYQMDKILVYEQGGNLYFFDQNIEQIDNNKIFILV